MQTARAAESAEGRLILKHVTPTTIDFSDPPQRVVGHLETAQFVGFWDQGADSFGDDPPNAVLAFLGDGEEVPREVVIEISDPLLAEEDLSYVVTVLEGTLPLSAKGYSLFIDPMGRPLSPLSIAGMNRCRRRRDRREDRRDRR